MKNIKSLFFDEDGFVTNGTVLQFQNENKDTSQLYRKQYKEDDVEYSRYLELNPKIKKLIKIYRSYLYEIRSNPNTNYLHVEKPTASKIYHNLGRLDISCIDKLIANPELLHKLLQMNKVECLKYLKANKL